MEDATGTLSIVIPAYNEEATLETVVNRVQEVDLGAIKKEIVLVDDCSADKTQEIMERLSETHPNIVVCCHEKNQGKGAALNTGFARCTGDWVIVQDADLEYNPEEFPILLEPVLQGVADVVYGSRFLSGGAHRVLYYWHSVGNRVLTTYSNMMSNLNLTDMETGYKLFNREILQKITLQENRFGIEPEITAKISKLGCRIYEVGISYYGRTYAEGKKIDWKDGVRAVWCITKYNLAG